MRQMKMGELVRASGVPRSTIHLYLRMGLLPKAIQSGLNIHLYDEVHLSILWEIRILREEERVPLSKIKEILKENNRGILAQNRYNGKGNTMEHAALERRVSNVDQKNKKREEILTAATQLFSQKGFENFRMEDLAARLQMSKSTFYLYFKDKEELLSACIERLGTAIMPIRNLKEVLKEEDLEKRIQKRLQIFFKYFPTFSGILNLAKSIAVGENTHLSKKAIKAFKIVTQPVKKDLEEAQQKGYNLKIDPELASYMALGAAETLAYRLSLDSRYTLKQAQEAAMKLFRHGIWNPANSELRPNDAEPL